MRDKEEIRNHPRVNIDREDSEGMGGMIAMPGWSGSVIATFGAGWDHVSVAPFQKRVTPSWNDMCILKDIFFKEDEVAIQIHPAKSEYVNNVDNCLHLWRCNYKEMVLPPSILVGLKPGMTAKQIREEIAEAYVLAGEEP